MRPAKCRSTPLDAADMSGSGSAQYRVRSRSRIGKRTLVWIFPVPDISLLPELWKRLRQKARRSGRRANFALRVRPGLLHVSQTRSGKCSEVWWFARRESRSVGSLPAAPARLRIQMSQGWKRRISWRQWGLWQREMKTSRPRKYLSTMEALAVE